MIGITEEGGQANEAFQFYATDNDDGTNVTYNNDTYYKTFYREEGKTSAEQTIGQVGVSQINYQAYRLPLTSVVDPNIDRDLYLDDDIINSSFAGVGVSFFQTPTTNYSW